jgi:hypothetical protein
VLGALDDGDTLTEVSGLRTGLFSGRAAADDKQIKVFGTPHANLL